MKFDNLNDIIIIEGDKMRRSRKNNGTGKIGLFIVIIIVALIVLGKIFIGDNSKKAYMEYVKSYEDALLKYSSEQLASSQPITTYQFKDFTELLVGSGYLEKWEDTNVELEASPIILEKVDDNTSFYNYNNSETLENRFEIKFTKAGKQFTCTKNDCK